MKKIFKTMAFVAAVAASVGLASCAKEDTAKALSGDALPKVTLTGYVEAMTDSVLTAATPKVYQYAKAGITVIATINNVSLGIGTSGDWTGTTTTDENGKYTISVPMSATTATTAVSLDVAPFVAEYTGTKTPVKQWIFDSENGGTSGAATLYKETKEAFADNNIVCGKIRIYNE